MGDTVKGDGQKAGIRPHYFELINRCRIPFQNSLRIFIKHGVQGGDTAKESRYYRLVVTPLAGFGGV